MNAVDRDSLLQIFLLKAEVADDFLGLDEGSVFDESLSVFDVGEADPDRDWLKSVQGEISLKFYFESEGSSKKFIEVLRELSQKLKFETHVSKVEEEDYGKKWRESFQGVDVAKVWSIRPDWSALPVDPSRQLIRLNPSLGFGFGNHPTTQGCLEFLEDLNDLRDKRVLDFGSGSGILSVAACLLGASEVVAIEIEDSARESAIQVFQMNQCEGRIKSYKNLSLEQSFSFDLVLANIISSVLQNQAKNYLACLSNQSCLIVSGILDPEVEEMKDFFNSSFKELGFEIKSERHLAKESWNSFLFQLERR